MQMVQPEIKSLVLTDDYGKFVIEPLERGFGVTLGNAMRRALLSSLAGAAITSVKISGVLHEFSTIPGVVEDVTDIILNLKGVRFKMHGNEAQVLRLRAEDVKEVKADHIEPTQDIEILNPDWHIATITDKKTKLFMELKVGKGRGYHPVEKREQESEIGVIPVDAIYSPVQKVNFTVEDARVGQATDYNRLLLEVWTDKSVKPDEAVSGASKILVQQFSLFLKLTGETLELPGMAKEVSGEQSELLERRIEEFDFPNRAQNVFKKAKIATLGDLVQKTEKELMTMRSLGKATLEEVRSQLEKLGVTLSDEEK